MIQKTNLCFHWKPQFNMNSRKEELTLFRIYEKVPRTKNGEDIKLIRTNLIKDTCNNPNLLTLSTKKKRKKRLLPLKRETIIFKTYTKVYFFYTLSIYSIKSVLASVLKTLYSLCKDEPEKSTKINEKRGFF